MAPVRKRNSIHTSNELIFIEIVMQEKKSTTINFEPVFIGPTIFVGFSDKALRTYMSSLRY